MQAQASSTAEINNGMAQKAQKLNWINYKSRKSQAHLELKFVYNKEAQSLNDIGLKLKQQVRSISTEHCGLMETNLRQCSSRLFLFFYHNWWLFTKTKTSQRWFGQKMAAQLKFKTDFFNIKCFSRLGSKKVAFFDLNGRRLARQLLSCTFAIQATC